MKGLVIAAGDGTRLHPYTKKKCKALVPLLGLSLVERVILSAKEAGIKEFVVVSGYEGELLKERIGDGTSYGVKIEWVHNPDWEKGNGVSVFKARDHFGSGERFVLMMCDHMFDPDTLRLLLQRKDKENILCVDKKIDRVFDLDDATKVLVEGDKIVEIGKGLKKFNAIDCGMFLCSYSLFESLEKSIQENKDSLSDGVEVLIDKNEMRACDVKGGFWADIDTPKSLKFVKMRLIQSLPNPREGIISRKINRKVSLQITKYLSSTPLTPNQISFLGFLVGLASAVLFGLGRFPWVLGAGLLAQFSSILDGVDGEVARLKLIKSSYGDFIDSVFDRYVDGFMILGMTFGVYFVSHNLWVWIVGWIALVGASLSSFYKEKYKVATGKTYISQKYDGWLRYIFAGRDSRLFLIMLGGVLNQVLVVLYIIALTSNVLAIYRFFSFRRLLD